MRYPRYKYQNPPLQEAIFEAKFSYENFDSTLPGQFYEKVRSQFPEKNDLKVITVTLGTAHPSIQQRNPQGPVIQAWNPERTSCLQFGPGIIAANLLKYKGWELFIPSISLILKSYFDCAYPKAAKRIGLRYINRILIPENNVKISDYFQMDISFPDTLLNPHAFDITLIKETVFNQLEITTKVRFASDSLKPGEKGVAFLLDIDSFVTNNIPLEPKGILQITDSCHGCLEEVFESALQDKTRNIFGGVKK